MAAACCRIRDIETFRTNSLYASTSQHSRAHQHRHTFASAPPLLRAPAPIAAPAPFLPKTYALRYRTLCVAAHTRGLTHTHNILYETSQKRIRKNCRGGFSPSTARVAQNTQVWGKTPPNRQHKRAEARRARGAGRGRRGGRGSPPPHPAPAPPDASMELRRIRELLGGCPISIVVTEAYTASAPWLDGPSHSPSGPGDLSLSLSPQGANLCCCNDCR